MILFVIPANAGIQEFWMLNRVQHQRVRTRADLTESWSPRRKRVGSRHSVFHCGFIPTKL